MSTKPMYLPVTAIATRLRCSRQTVYNRIASGKLTVKQFVEDGAVYVVNDEKLAAFQCKNGRKVRA